MLHARTSSQSCAPLLVMHLTAVLVAAHTRCGRVEANSVTEDTLMLAMSLSTSTARAAFLTLFVDRDSFGERNEIEVPTDCAVIRDLTQAFQRGLSLRSKKPVVSQDRNLLRPRATLSALLRQQRPRRRDQTTLQQALPSRARTLLPRSS